MGLLALMWLVKSRRAARAELLRRVGRNAEAVLAYEAAIIRTANATERDFLQRSRHALTRA